MAFTYLKHRALAEAASANSQHDLESSLSVNGARVRSFPGGAVRNATNQNVPPPTPGGGPDMWSCPAERCPRAEFANSRRSKEPPQFDAERSIIFGLMHCLCADSVHQLRSRQSTAPIHAF